MIWAALALVAAGAVIWGVASSNLILKNERSPLDFSPESFGREFETFTVLTDDEVRVEGWLVRCKRPSESLIVVMHGWGANRADVLPSTLFLGESYNLAYFDFRNHGRSGGNVTSLGCLEIKDFESVVRYLLDERGPLAQKLGVFGFSMGGSIALAGAPGIPEIRAVVAESPFSSFNDTVERFAGLFYGIPRWVTPLTLLFARIRLGFDPETCSPIRRVAAISPRPVFLIQSGNDLRMPPSEGKKLFEAAGEPKELWTVPESDHGEASEKSPEEYRKRILSFYEKWL